MGTAPDSLAASPRPADPAFVLRELANRWRRAISLEYRSQVIVNHAGEFRLDLRTHIYLRRPGRARMIFRASTFPEADRLRVCDGKQIFDRMFGRPGDTSRTITSPLKSFEKITEDLSHPLDEAGYSAAQFFSQAPFSPPPWFGGGTEGALRVTARRLRQTIPGISNVPGKNDEKRDVYELVFLRGTSRDTLALDALSYSPLRLIRVGSHGGRVQELMRETFQEVHLDPSLPDALFRWSPRDDAGYSETTS
jgi:outer membrane lipoprotein-sorting protein